MTKSFPYLLGCLLFISSSTQAMVFDNRFWPLYREPFFALDTACWSYGARALFLGANHSFGGCGEESLFEGDDLPLFRLYGSYDEAQLDRALQDAGVTQQALLRSDLQTAGKLVWQPLGKISLRGLVFETLVSYGWFGLGGSFIVGKVNSHLELEREHDGRKFSLGEENELLLANKKIHEALGLTTPCYAAPVCGDLDLYLRFHAVRDYWHTVRHLDAGFNIGALIPTASARTINNPASLSIGGDKHLGFYGEFEGTFVLKEDVSVGLLFRVSKRLARTSIQRMPFATEPTNYGVLVGPARVEPGVTVIFEPRVEFEGLRDGLGLHAAYTLVHHSKDTWTDRRCDQTVKANTCLLEERSEWGSDYFSITALYDFGYDKQDAWCAPIISLTVDIPFKGAVTNRVTKTTGISLRIESRL